MTKRSMRKWLFLIVAVDVLLYGLLTYTNSRLTATTDNEQRISQSTIKRICELATLDCYYHNVTEWNKPSNWLGYGEKALWLEYDGKVRVGIKVGEIKISEPDSTGIITVSIPQATILENDLDENSLYEIDSESPMLGFIPIYSSVNSTDRRDALAEAQRQMETSASQNRIILEEATERAKKIIEKNIVAIGEARGKVYTVKFTDVLEEQPKRPETEN